MPAVRVAGEELREPATPPGSTRRLATSGRIAREELRDTDPEQRARLEATRGRMFSPPCVLHHL